MESIQNHNILVVGSTGMLGSELIEHLKLINNKSISIDIIPNSKESFKDENLIDDIFNRFEPTCVVNCSAYTKVDDAELKENENDVKFSNITIPKILVRYCKKYNSRLIHISTDYVYSGERDVIVTEEDPIRPVNFYGVTKGLGEVEIVMNGIGFKDYVILRTAWLYGKNGKHFVDTMLKLFEKKVSPLKVVDDQYGCPTSCETLIGYIEECIFSDNIDRDVFNAVCDGYTTWYDFAKTIYELSEYSNNNIEINPCLSEEYKTIANRPKFNKLSIEHWKSKMNYKPMNWKDVLNIFLQTKENKGK